MMKEEAAEQVIISPESVHHRTMAIEDLEAAWRQSRSGAWAFRGFYYQHLLTTLLIVRQWAGLSPSGFIVPEGLEDCVIELREGDVRIQIKSRKDGTFTEGEVDGVRQRIAAKAKSAEGTVTRTVVALEQSCDGRDDRPIEQLFEVSPWNVVVCRRPEREIIQLLSQQLGSAEIICEGIASDLYKLVSEAAEANASLPFNMRRRISTTEVERRIYERLEAEDPSAIDEALASGILESVDFVTPVGEPSFYLGVKVKPGHVAAGLVIERPRETKEIAKQLRERRQVILSAPSGGGKSALMWLTAKSLTRKVRWFEVAAKVSVQDIAAIARFIRARRPSEESPIGILLDDIGSSSSDLWNTLARELRALPAVYFLGSMRREDASLIADRAEVAIRDVNLDEELAQTIWQKLSGSGDTRRTHWRESFEQSAGLMLEYIHLLTQGRRLAEVIEDQVRQREREGREIELAIIRGTAALCSRGGEIRAARLFDLLDIPATLASQALRRLVDEHLVRESGLGVLGGLHDLRSAALCKASHDESVFLVMDSVWASLPSATHETLPHIIQSILGEGDVDAEGDALKRLAGILASSSDAELWVAVMTGLGLATLDRHVEIFARTLELKGVARASWFLAAMFSDPKLEIPDLGENDNWTRLKEALLAFRKAPKPDLRHACLEFLPDSTAAPACTSLEQADALLACLAPIGGGDAIRIKLKPEISGEGAPDIKKLASLLSAAHHNDPELATAMVEAFGGEEALLTLFARQIPWVTMPVFETGRHGRTIRSDWLYVGDPYQSDPHQTVCDICETLIALAPSAEAAACDAVNAQGTPVNVGSYQPWSKDMPRENIPAKARVAWNVAFRQILASKFPAGSLTEYATEMSNLVRRTEKLFRAFSEKWIRAKQITKAQALADDVNELIVAVNALAYADYQKPAPVMSQPQGAGSSNDTIGALLTGILGNLMGRMGAITAEARVRATAAHAGSLATQAREHAKSTIWRTVQTPPIGELTALSKRLEDVASILRQFGEDSSPPAVQAMTKAAQRGDFGKAVQAAARRSRLLAEQRFNRILKRLEADLLANNCEAKCWTKPAGSDEAADGSAREIAIVLKSANFEAFASQLETAVALGRQHLESTWRFSVVPAIYDRVIAPMAVQPTSLSSSLLPNVDFELDWRDHIAMPFVPTALVQSVEKAIGSCVQVSAIMTFRGVTGLHPAEDDTLSKILQAFEESHQLVEEAATRTRAEDVQLALDFIDVTWTRVLTEHEYLKAGKSVSEPLCASGLASASGHVDQAAAEFAYVRCQVLEGEAARAVEKGES
jgi:hypothetical protein